MIKRPLLLLSLVLTPLLVACQENSERIYGVVERHSATITAPASEKISRILVEEGDQLRPGEVILQLDSTQSQYLIRQRQAELQQATARLNLLEAGSRKEAIVRAEAAATAAKAEYQSAGKTLDRDRQLFRDNMINEAELDAAKTQSQVTLARWKSAQAQLEELRAGPRQQEIEQAKAAVTAAEARLNSARHQQEQLIVRSEITGVIDQLPWQVGDRVTAGTLLATVLDDQKPYVRAYLPQSLLNKLTTGTEVVLQHSNGEMRYQGIVRRIHTQPAFTPFFALNEENRDRLMFLVDIDLQGDARTLATGLALEVLLP